MLISQSLWVLGDQPEVTADVGTECRRSASIGGCPDLDTRGEHSARLSNGGCRGLGFRGKHSARLSNGA